MKKMTGFYSGINFGGWFSQCDYTEERFNNFIVEADFAKVSEWGFDHVRIPVDYNLLEDEEGNYIESGFERLDRAIELCRKYGLNMVLDLHKAVGFSFDKGENEAGLFENEEYQELFYDLWNQLAKRYANNSDMLAFELLNEVTDPEMMSAWNKMADNAIKIIRKYSKDIKILIGGYYNNNVEAVPAIKVTVDDNIVYNFHCYEPILFTHQGAYWIDGMPTDFRYAYKHTFGEYIDTMRGMIDQFIPLHYQLDPEAVPDVSFFRERFKEAIEYAEENGVALYCGEYGIIELANLPDTLSWYEEIHEVFSEYGIGHALWSYKEMDFDFAGERMTPIRQAIIDSSKK